MSTTTTPPPATSPATLPLTGSRRRILELLHRYRYLTPRLLALAYSSGHDRASSHVRHELATLKRHGLVERHYDSKRPTGQGSDQYIYTLSLQGGRRVLDPPTYSQQRHRISRRSQREQGNYDHHLALSELQLILDLGSSGWTVENFRTDERTPLSRFTVPLDGRQHTAQPDVWATFALPTGQRPLYLFELDLVRKDNQRTARRFEAYATYLTSPDRQKMLARENATYAAVVFITPNEAELERFIEMAAPIVSRWSRRDRPQCFFWNIEDWYEQKKMQRREAVGTPDERTREWTITRLRDPRSILQARSVYDIHGKERWLVQGID